VILYHNELLFGLFVCWWYYLWLW